MAILVPSEVELGLLSEGLLVAGVDEVGRGALAGPVVAAAVVLPPDFIRSCPLPIRDSKKLTPLQRYSLFHKILEVAVCWNCRGVSPQVIDAIGIAAAARLAMTNAVLALSPLPDHVLVDGFSLPDLAIPNTGVVRGDSLCLSIASASVVAKVVRDAIMERYAAKYPHYGFDRHKGYGTPAHLQALQRWGPSPLHRRSFAPVANVGSYGPRAHSVG